MWQQPSACTSTVCGTPVNGAISPNTSQRPSRMRLFPVKTSTAPVEMEKALSPRSPLRMILSYQSACLLVLSLPVPIERSESAIPARIKASATA